MDDELLTALVAKTHSQCSLAFAALAEVRFTRAVMCFAVGLFALVNNWPVVGIPAFVLAAVAAYGAVCAYHNAKDLYKHSQGLLKR